MLDCRVVGCQETGALSCPQRDTLFKLCKGRIMQAARWTMGALIMVLLLATAGVGWADRHGPRYRGGQTYEEPAAEMAREAQEPMMHHMQGMMQQMRGMMRDMQGMMDGLEDDDEMPYGRRMRRGMMAPMSGRGMMGHHGGGHGHQMLRRMERLTRDLGLSEQQEKQIRSRIRDHMKQAIQIRAELATQRIELLEHLDADTVEMAKVKALLQSMAARKADLRFAHLSLMQEIKQQLTPEQQKKFRAWGGYMMHDEGPMGYGGMRRHGRDGRWHEMGHGRRMGRGAMRNPCSMKSGGEKDR